jgi:transglutaminase-like putative cysteine protease
MAAGAGSPADELLRLARGTARILSDDLAGGADADAARVAARGRADCVGHAALFAALARARGHTVRLVTGFRLDGRRLVRHAWAIALLPDRALALDPTTGAPVDGRYLPLAVHGAAAAEVALSSELAYAGMTGARARFIAPRSARSIPRTP